MSTVLNDVRPALYVSTYKKYNEGSLFGKWLYLDDYADTDDFYEAVYQLHSDEDRFNIEPMFNDFEGFPRSLYCECGGLQELYQYIDFLQSTYLSKEAVDAGLELDIPLDKIEDAYQGEYDSDEAFAQQLAEDCGMMPESLSWPLSHIDWQSAARELMYDFNESNGHYFSSNW